MTSKIAVALALAGVLSVAACGGRPQPPRGGGPGGGPSGPAGGFSGLIAQPVGLLFADFDLDSDRRVTREETEAGSASTWTLMDANGDGAGSALEFADWAKAVMGSENAVPGRVAFDRNADGSVSSGELRTGLFAEFDRLDRNGDDALSRDELVRLIEPRGMGMTGGEGEGFVLRREGGPGGPPGGGP
jgi:hypothetical protein